MDSEAEGFDEGLGSCATRSPARGWRWGAGAAASDAPPWERSAHPEEEKTAEEETQFLREPGVGCVWIANDPWRTAAPTLYAVVTLSAGAVVQGDIAVDVAPDGSGFSARRMKIDVLPAAVAEAEAALAVGRAGVVSAGPGLCVAHPHQPRPRPLGDAAVGTRGNQPEAAGGGDAADEEAWRTESRGIGRADIRVVVEHADGRSCMRLYGRSERATLSDPARGERGRPGPERLPVSAGETAPSGSVAPPPVDPSESASSVEPAGATFWSPQPADLFERLRQLIARTDGAAVLGGWDLGKDPQHVVLPPKTARVQFRDDVADGAATGSEGRLDGPWRIDGGADVCTVSTTAAGRAGPAADPGVGGNAAHAAAPPEKQIPGMGGGGGS